MHKFMAHIIHFNSLFMFNNFNALSEQAVVAHTCHGHRYWPSPIALSGTGKEKGGGGGTCTGWYKGEQAIRPMLEGLIINEKICFISC